MEQLEPVFFGRFAEMAAELPGQETGIAESAAVGDLLDRDPGQGKHAANPFQPQPDHILGGRNAELSAEHPAQGSYTDSAGGGDPFP